MYKHLRKKITFLFILFTISIVTAACQPKTVEQKAQISHLNSQDSTVCADLGRFPQDLMAYLDTKNASDPLFTADRQAELTTRAKKNFFAPWQLKNGTRGADNALWAIKGLAWKKGFGVNMRPFEEKLWFELVKNSNLGAYAQNAATPRYGITLSDTWLRAMPTLLPMFWNPEEAGEGFPFDMMQQSTLWIGTPVLITHTSKDGNWVFAETVRVKGWLLASTVAEVNEDFKNFWQNKKFAVITKDKLELAASRDSKTGSKYAHIGTILPFADPEHQNTNSGYYTVAYPVSVSKEHNTAGYALASLKIGDAEVWPMPYTQANVARIGSNMMGQPYGWAGMYSNRDCSALVCDLFFPFGLWLPRNSQNQAATGEKLSIEGMTPNQKEEFIKANGKPFQTLIGMPGHIALYIGTYNGTPVMFHNIWGLRTIDPATADAEKPTSRRAVIGKAVVTSLRPGVERSDLAHKDGLIERMKSINVPGKSPAIQVLK